jgi:HEAT repeat protein
MEEVVGSIPTRSTKSPVHVPKTDSVPANGPLLLSTKVTSRERMTNSFFQHPWRKKMKVSSSLRMNKVAFALALIGLSLSAALPSFAIQIDKAWSLLQNGATDKGKEHREHAVKALGLLPSNTRAIDLATNALADTAPEVRAAAAESLGHMRARSAVPKLKGILETEKDVQVIIAGARALISLGDHSGYDVYYSVLTGDKKSSGGMLDDQKKMLHDPKKMAQFGFEEGIGFVPFAGIGVEAFKAIRKDDASPVRAAAARVLAEDPDPNTTEALLNAASDKSWLVRAAALDAISRRNDASLAEKIETHLDDPKEEVRFTAAAAIIHLANGKESRRKAR